MQKHGHYRRSVILPDGKVPQKPFGVHRYRCATCRHTLSFLPDFCVPYKHYAADVINKALYAILILSLSVNAIANPTSSYNAAGFSVFAVCQWRRQFCANSFNVWTFGFPRLFGGVAPGVATPPSSLSEIIRFAVDRGSKIYQSFRIVQPILSQAFPPFGLFRAMLLPGCST